MNVKDILPAPTEDQEAFILDHGKTTDDGALKYRDDMTSYEWNIRYFKKLHVGAYVLNRHSGKATKDRKFEIYSGGYVESISEPDEDGNVIAKITHAFTFVTPLRQGSTFLENFKWDSKTKKGDSWGHFWNQYGMNKISMTDFWNLVEGQNCVLFDPSLHKVEDDLTNEEVQELSKSDVSSTGFSVTVVEEGKVHKKSKNKYTGVAKKIDFAKVQKSKNKTGKLGELIVLDLLTEEAKLKGLKKPEHVSLTRGDGLGYDILAYDSVGDEIHVEVKTSKGKYADGFDISSNEVAASQVKDSVYKIYRVYALNTKTKECKLQVYEGPIADESCKLVPTQFKFYKK